MPNQTQQNYKPGNEAIEQKTSWFKKNEKIIVAIVITGIVSVVVTLLAVNSHVKRQLYFANSIIPSAEPINREQVIAKKSTLATTDNGQDLPTVSNGHYDGDEIDTSNWQTYRNEEYGFELEYPARWIVKEDGSNVWFWRDISIEEQSRRELGAPFIITIEKKQFNSIEEWFNKSFLDREQKLKPEQYQFMTINGFKAIKYNDPMSIGGCDENFIFIKDVNLFKLVRHESTCDYPNDLFSQILSTFRFLEDWEIKWERELEEINEFNKNEPDICKHKPIPTAIGRDIYSTNIEKYGDIGFLGELFTAHDCRPDRLNKIFGIDKDNNYTLMPDIGLKSEPPKELIAVFEDIGFEPSNTCNQVTSSYKCKRWTLLKIVPVEEILKLKPFARQIKSSGCINCG